MFKAFTSTKKYLKSFVIVFFLLNLLSYKTIAATRFLVVADRDDYSNVNLADRVVIVIIFPCATKATGYDNYYNAKTYQKNK